jgi:hypothetical protein
MQNKILYVIVIVLIAIIFFQRDGCTYIPSTVPQEIKIDTFIKIVKVHDTIPGKPILIKAKRDTLWKDSLIFKPDTNYDKLVKQYMSLLDSHFTKNIYSTTYQLDSFGTATVTDTVITNKITGRLMDYSLNIPTKTIKITITKPAPPTRQVYLGGGIGGNSGNIIRSAYIGGLYKDRSDRMFGVQVGIDNQLFYGVSSYWKIKVK